MNQQEPVLTTLVLHLKKNDAAQPSGTRHAKNTEPTQGHSQARSIVFLSGDDHSLAKQTLVGTQSTATASPPSQRSSPTSSPLELHDRVVWLSDAGPEYGTVRWIGVLPGTASHVMAGVEFDNPVGSGTGLFDRQRLFIARRNHASLVPLLGLIKAADFESHVPARVEAAPPSQPRKSDVDVISYEVEHSFKTVPVEPAEEKKEAPEEVLVIPHQRHVRFATFEDQRRL